MHFLPDVYVPCDICGGKRYNKETLDIKFKDKNIADVLDMRVSEALKFFENIPKVYNKLKIMEEASSAFYVKRKSSFIISSHFGFFGIGKYVSNIIKYPNICCRITTRGSTNSILSDLN